MISVLSYLVAAFIALTYAPYRLDNHAIVTASIKGFLTSMIVIYVLLVGILLFHLMQVNSIRVLICPKNDQRSDKTGDHPWHALLASDRVGQRIWHRDRHCADINRPRPL